MKNGSLSAVDQITHIISFCCLLLSSPNSIDFQGLSTSDEFKRKVYRASSNFCGSEPWVGIADRESLCACLRATGEAVIWPWFANRERKTFSIAINDSQKDFGTPTTSDKERLNPSDLSSELSHQR
jgi:hypothetical protein